jgi:hypothetical protein
MRSWRHSSSGPVALAEATYETILAIRSFCETSSMDNDIPIPDISRADVYHKLRYPNKGHMNEQNPKPEIPRLLAIRTLIIQGQPSSEGIATHTQDQIFYDPSGCRAYAHLPMIWRCRCLSHYYMIWVLLRVAPLAKFSLSLFVKGEVQHAGECVTAAPVYASRVV